MKINPLTCIDFYKSGHRKQYPAGTNLVYSNFTPRSDRLAKKGIMYDGKIVFFGLQYFVKSFLIETFNTEFFQKPKEEVIAKELLQFHNLRDKGMACNEEDYWDIRSSFLYAEISHKQLRKEIKQKFRRNKIND